MSLIARYRLDNDFLDSSGNELHGTLRGSAVYTNNGLVSKAMYMDMNNNVGVTSFPANFDEYSICARIKLSAYNVGQYNAIINQSGGSGKHKFSLFVQDNTGFIGCWVYDNNGDSGLNSFITNFKINLNTWYSLVFKIKGNLLEIYVDGTKIASTTTMGNLIQYSNLDLNIGRWYGGGYGFAGYIQDVRIYDHALSLKEIKELAKAKILHLSFDDYEEPTTNYNPYPYILTTANCFRPTLLPGMGYKGRNAVKIEKLSTDGPGDWQYSFNTIPAYSAGDSFVLSLKYKSSGGFFSLGDWAGGNGNQPGWTKIEDKEIEDGWRYRAATITYNAASAGGHITGLNSMTPGSWIIFCDFQLEKKKIATPFTEGTRYKVNLHADAYNIYNNFSMPASLVATGEYYLGEKVYRLTMTPTTQAQVDSMKVIFFNHGIFAANMTFLANTKYATSCLWRPVNKPDTIVGGVASNISGFVEGPREKFKDGWNRYNRYRVGEATDKTDGIHISMISPSMVLGDSLIVDFCGLRTEKDTIYCSKYSNGIIEDKSDFGNHVNITDVATAAPYTEDSRLGKQALNFDGKMRPIAFSKIVPGCLTNCTVAFWRKSSNTGYELILNERDSRLGETLDGYFMACAGAPFYSQTSKVTGNQNLYIDGVLKSGAEKTFINDGNWHHYVMSGVNLSLFSKLMMNTYSAPGVSGATDWHLKSKLDDFRIYATELSQADVLELYKVRASIDKLGNIFAHTIETNDVEDGLIAYYPLNGDVLDHKNNYDGVINSGTSYGAGLKGRNGVKITSATDSITFPTLPVLPKEKSLSFWIKSDRPLSANDDLWIGYFNIADKTVGGKFGMMYGVGQCQDFGFWGYSNDASVESVNNKWSSDGNWHHVAVIEDIDRKIKIYVDGIQKKIVPHSADTTKIDFVTLQSDTIASNIFSIKTYTGQSWTGMTYCQFQDVRIYNKALTSDIVSKLYNWSHEKFSISKKGSVKANKISTRGVTDRLIAHWPLNGDTKDYVSGLNGTNVNGIVSPGLSQKCYYFSKTTNERITIPNNDKLNPKYISIQMWIKPLDLSNVENNFICKEQQYELRVAEGKIWWALYTENSGIWYWVDTGITVNSNEWVNISFVYDGISVKVYKNGTLLSDVPYAKGTVKTATGTLQIGNREAKNDASEGFRGYIQDVKLYTKALSPAEIKLNYNLTKADRIPYSISKNGILYVKDTKEGL